MDQTQAPIIDALEAVRRRRPADFGAPGHGSGRAAAADIRRLVGTSAFAADVLTPKGLDDRTETLQAVQTAHKLAAGAWGGDVARFATGGSTQNLHVMLAAVAGPGDKVLIASNAHKAEWAAGIYGGLALEPIPVETDRELDIEHGVSPRTLKAALEAHADAKAVLVVSPSYFGVTSDIPALAEICHAYGVPLIVDAAWGAAFGFNPRLPQNPLAQGADGMVVSAHKTLAALGQGSVAVMRGGLIDPVRFALAFELFQTTSPSVAVLASLDTTRRQMALHGEAIWDRVIDIAERTRSKLVDVPGVKVLTRLDLPADGAVALSPCVLTLDVRALKVCAFDADDWLVKTHQVVAGLSDFHHLLFHFTQGASERDAQRLVRAVKALAELATSAHSPFSPPPPAPSVGELTFERALAAPEAFAADTVLVPFAEAEGRISAELIAPAPPGVPRLIPGQRVTRRHVAYLTALHSAHGFLLDPADDPEQAKLRVVAGAAAKTLTKPQPGTSGDGREANGR